MIQVASVVLQGGSSFAFKKDRLFELEINEPVSPRNFQAIKAEGKISLVHQVDNSTNIADTSRARTLCGK